MNLRQIRRRTPKYLVLLLEEPVPAHQFTNLRILARGHVFCYRQASVTSVSISDPFRHC